MAKLDRAASSSPPLLAPSPSIWGSEGPATAWSWCSVQGRSLLGRWKLMAWSTPKEPDSVFQTPAVEPGLTLGLPRLGEGRLHTVDAVIC